MSDWLHIKKLEMLVVKANYKKLLINNLEEIFLSCELLNIARGRCEVTLLKVLNTDLNKAIYQFKKALMKANIELDNEYFNNLNDTLLSMEIKNQKKLG